MITPAGNILWRQLRLDIAQTDHTFKGSRSRVICSDKNRSASSGLTKCWDYRRAFLNCLRVANYSAIIRRSFLRGYEHSRHDRAISREAKVPELGGTMGEAFVSGGGRTKNKSPPPRWEADAGVLLVGKRKRLGR